MCLSLSRRNQYFFLSRQFNKFGEFDQGFQLKLTLPRTFYVTESRGSQSANKTFNQVRNFLRPGDYPEFPITKPTRIVFFQIIRMGQPSKL